MHTRESLPGGRAPSAMEARAAGNVAALHTLRHIQGQRRTANEGERAVLAMWSGWGALPAVFDQDAAAYEKFERVRRDLRRLLSPDELAAAKRSTLNAHYTDPAYVEAIWQAVEALGFRQGRVLEPGCGSGNFIALAPAGAQMTGVELDPVTAAIAGALYPTAQLRHESFAESPFAEDSFDLVVGNVPFGDIVLHDRRHNAGRHSIHNHFLVKSLRLTRPGGMVAAITSRYTLDAINPAARREMAELADLVGAVRLPSGAHRLTAGTDVVTDVLIFRRRERGAGRAGAAFERSQRLGNDGDSLYVNEYFRDHPEHVLGELRATQGELGRLELDVVGDRAAGPRLAAALAGIAEAARSAELRYREPVEAESAGAEPIAAVATAETKPEGYLAHGPDRVFTRIEAGAEVRYAPAASQARELGELIDLRETVVALLETEAHTSDDGPELEALRQRLNFQYDAYVTRFGPLNRFSERLTGYIDEETGERRRARIRPRQGGFRTDPFANVVYALEHFDSSTQTAAKATIFHERVLVRRAQRLGADTPADALAICLDTFGEVRLDEVARLLGVDAAQARADLGEAVFDEPGTERLIPAAEYLSGNVRTKLKAAEIAMASDSRYAANVTALAAIQPRDLAPDEISAQLGAAWIDGRYVEQFLRETLDDPSLTVDHPGASLWTVSSNNLKSVEATSQWGTERYPAPQIAQTLLEQRPIRIYDEDPSGERRFNAEATDAAVEKANELAERFSEWVWQEPERARRLTRRYNDRFNAIVPRSYDGASLSLPGLAITFRPRPHQLAAVARIIQEPSVGLFHEVGAGKTAEMVMGAMELKRLGLANKPVIVVPNHMLEQFSREWLQMYPQARILAASTDDLDREGRRLFQAKCATGDWDGVIMTRSAFERVPMSPAAQKRFLVREVAAIDAMLERAKATSSRFTLKRIEKLKSRLEERIKDKLDTVKDPGLTFEMLGIDYIFADEAHAYKNLRATSNIPGMAVDGSMRATDLHMKIEFLRERRGRVATLATATPIANSMGEAYAMQRYLRPDLLEEAGIGDFDQWAATFGKTTTAIEVAADGSGLRMQTRFASFRNVPELLQLWQVAADIKTAEDLQLPVPALRARSSDDQRLPEIVVIQPSSELRQFVKLLAVRADRVRGRGVDPSIDNLLKIASDGRAAGLDLRLLGMETADAQKTEVAAERIAAIYHAHRSDTYRGPTGALHPRPGALQLVFSDLGVPKDDAWNVYDALRALLVDKGLPKDAVRFIHEARDDREKAELFAACRDGRIGVLCGSTERMGVGTNVQLRAIALHHLDCPWRPADLAQREGRILRQGNANPEVQILRYVTEGSFDGYLWQTVARKATFIAQVMRGKLDVREIEDIGESALSFNEVKALATGNPLLLEHARVHAEVTRFERLERAHASKEASLRWTIRHSEEKRAQRQAEIEQIDAATARSNAMKATQPEASTMEVRGRACRDSAQGNKALRQALMEFAVACERNKKQAPLRIGSLHGSALQVQPAIKQGDVLLELVDVPNTTLCVGPEDFTKGLPLTRLLHRLEELPHHRKNAEIDIRRAEVEARRARDELAKPFRHADRLELARAELKAIDDQLQADVVRRAIANAETAPPTTIMPDSATSALSVAVPLDAEERWRNAIAQAEAAITHRAETLSAKLKIRAAAITAALKTHCGAEPKKAGFFGMTTEYRAWAQQVATLRGRLERTNALEARTQVYLSADHTGLQSPLSALAVRRVVARSPELWKELQEQRVQQLRLTQQRDEHQRSRSR